MPQRWGDYTGSQPVWNKMGDVYIVGIYGRKDRGYGNWMARLRSPFAAGIPESRTENQQVKLFPNPAFQFIRLGFDLKEDRIIKFTIYNLAGQAAAELLEQKCTAGKNELQFNIAPLAPGTYLVKGTDNQGQVICTGRFVRQ